MRRAAAARGGTSSRGGAPLAPGGRCRGAPDPRPQVRCPHLCASLPFVVLHSVLQYVLHYVFCVRADLRAGKRPGHTPQLCATCCPAGHAQGHESAGQVGSCAGPRGGGASAPGHASAAVQAAALVCGEGDWIESSVAKLGGTAVAVGSVAWLRQKTDKAV